MQVIGFFVWIYDITFREIDRQMTLVNLMILTMLILCIPKFVLVLFTLYVLVQ